MQIREFAEGLLLADRLSDKLTWIPDLVDDDPSLKGSLPEFPHRPPELMFSPRPETSSGLKKIKALRNDAERGQLLHFFANHELLAIELMALALLKFPDADPTFRRQLVQTISDEQKHTRLYLHRMKECGIFLGDVPLSASFWQRLKGMKSPQEYICAMSLTLEQANLDFALEYEARFRQIGDEATARILRTVYEDEVFHVRVGVDWMERWKLPAESQWDFHLKHLRAPLSAVKAKSSFFNKQARLACGLNQDYIDQLEMYQRSKGRPPDVYWYNGLGESDLCKTGSISERRLDMEEDMESSLALLCGEDDLQILRRDWSLDFKRHLKESGRAVAETVLEHQDINHQHIGAFKPWMWTPSLKKKFGFLSTRQTRALRSDVKTWWEPGQLLLHSKVQHRALEQKIKKTELFRSPESLVFENEHGLLEVLGGNPFERWVLKAPYGSAGNGLRMGEGIDEWPRTWIKKILSEQKQIILEEKCDRLADFSILGEVINGELRWLGNTRMLIDTKGSYRGAIIGDEWFGCDSQLRKNLFVEGLPFYKKIEQDLGEILLPWFAENHYEGHFGVDMFVYSKNGHYHVRPCSEVNVRTSFGHIALELSKRVRMGRTTLMFFCPLETSMSFENLLMKSVDGFWEEGLIAINDVWKAKQIGVFCGVSKNMESMIDVLNQYSKSKLSDSINKLLTHSGAQLKY